MHDLKDFVAANPQVSASMITALFGILGIFINILINLWFRNKDYRNKNHMQQIENLEIYYIPLEEKTKHMINCIQNATENDNDNLYNILDNKVSAKYAKSIKILQEALDDYYKFLEESEYKYPNNYKLFKIHKKVKEEIFMLHQFTKNKTSVSQVETAEDIRSDLQYLIYRIQQYEIRITIHNFIIWRIEAVKLWKNKKL